MIKYDETILQSKTVGNIIELINDLWDFIDSSEDNETIKPFKYRVSRLKNEHNKALNNIHHFKGKSYKNKLKHMFSEEHHDSYKTTH
jgi:hypothetical protein